MQPWHQIVFEDPIEEVVAFEEKYHYFSDRPLVGRVSGLSEDIDLVKDLLLKVHERVSHIQKRVFVVSEILTKILAYRDLQENDKISIPWIDKQGGPILTEFTIDHIFNLWNGMPAFGLIPEEKHIAPILLYRGTDFSLDSKRGISSLLSDLDLSGPGRNTYLKARYTLRNWLEKVAKEKMKTQVMGYSLGGVLASYTLLYEHDLIIKDIRFPSISFAQPGVSQKIYNDWMHLPKKDKSPYMVFITKGDLVSKVGHLYGDVYVIHLDETLSPLHAHVALMSAKPYINIQYLSQVE